MQMLVITELKILPQPIIKPANHIPETYKDRITIKSLTQLLKALELTQNPLHRPKKKLTN